MSLSYEYNQNRSNIFPLKAPNTHTQKKPFLFIRGENKSNFIKIFVFSRCKIMTKYFTIREDERYLIFSVTNCELNLLIKYGK